MHEGVKSPVFKKYTVAGGGYKKNVKCPNCQSTDRTRLLYLFFKLRTDIYLKKTRLLHISPNILLARELKSIPTVTYTCGALTPESFSSFNAVKVDVSKMTFDENSFDVIVCNHVLEHVPDDATAMREIFRVLKPGGFAVLQVPLALDLEKTLEDKTITGRKERKIVFGQTDHLRLYGVDYFDKLTDIGFRVVRDNPFVNNWADNLERYSLDRNEDVFVCYK